MRKLVLFLFVAAASMAACSDTITDPVQDEPAAALIGGGQTMAAAQQDIYSLCHEAFQAEYGRDTRYPESMWAEYIWNEGALGYSCTTVTVWSPPGPGAWHYEYWWW
jgi:hypothetical protein